MLETLFDLAMAGVAAVLFTLSRFVGFTHGDGE